MLEYVYKDNQIDGVIYEGILLKLIYEYPNKNKVFASPLTKEQCLFIITSGEQLEKLYVYDVVKAQEIANEGFKGLELKAIAWSIDLWAEELQEYTVEELQQRNHIHE